MQKEPDVLIQLITHLVESPATLKEICHLLTMEDENVKILLKTLETAHILTESHNTYALSQNDFELSDSATFMHAPPGTWNELSEGVKAVLGIPYDGGKSSRSGAQFGPAAIRQVSEILCETSCESLLDLGTLPVEQESLFETRVLIYKSIKKIIKRGGIPVSLGGDHSVAYPCIRAVSEVKRCGYLFFDAHLDIHPASMEWFVGPHGTVLTRCLELEGVSAERVGIIGVREIPPELKTRLESEGIALYDMEEIRTQGIEATIQKAVSHIEKSGNTVYVSVDLDAVDPVYAPGIGSPAPGGMTPAEISTCCRMIPQNLELVGMDMVELFPSHDVGALSALIAAIIVKTLLCV